MRRILLALATTACALLPATAGAADLPACTTTRTTLSSVQSALAAAQPAETVCIADGTYTGTLTLTASKASPGVTVRAEHPGQAKLGRVAMGGSWITLAQADLTGIRISDPGSAHLTISHNRIHDGGNLIDATGTSYLTIDGNQLQRPGTDAIWITTNWQHLTITNNEITGVVENGDHSDAFQSCACSGHGGDHLVFSGNWEHDNFGQGFFIKDGPVTDVAFNDNLFERQTGSGAVSNVWDLTGFSGAHNTLWDGKGFLFRSGRCTDCEMTDSVIDLLERTDNTPFTSARNLLGTAPWTWTRAPSDQLAAWPAFRDPATHDYRLTDGTGRGVTWKPSDKTFGPTVGGPTPPPDRDGDGIPDASDQCPDQAGTQPNGCPPQPPDPGCDTACEADYQAQIAGLRDQLAAATASRDAWKQRAERAEALIARIHQETSP